MRPIELKLQSFGSYGDETVINFSDVKQNLFLVTGDTGSGKSTIFDAIVYALYGRTGSVENPKNGEELQSQFAPKGKEPFVELKFSEIRGGVEEIYRVIRVPKHKRTKLRGGGEKEVSASVSLIMPDGTEYPQKEADKKLEEIVGLTREQFMQVAMIAQGEFMKLLRAKSDEKKEIFRKLFRTGFFQKLVDELGQRVKKKSGEMANVRSVCQTLAAQIRIPDESSHKEILEECKDRIINERSLNSVVLEEFMKELGLLTEELEKETEEAEKKCREAEKKRDDIRAEYASAENIIKFFNQLEEAERKLEDCMETKVQAAENLERSKRIRDAYDIKNVAVLYNMSDKALKEAQEDQKKQEIRIRELESFEKELEKASTEKNTELHAELEKYSKVNEKVTKSLKLFRDIKNKEEELKRLEKSLEERTKDVQRAKEKLEAREAQEKSARDRSEELKNARERLVSFNENVKKLKDFGQESAQLSDRENELKEQREKVEKANKNYAVKREEEEKKSKAYEALRTKFIDAQAGFLARELKPGKPCPVCGSLEHPSPYKLTEDIENVTREGVEKLKKEAETSKAEQESAARECDVSRTRLAEMEQGYQRNIEQLRGKIRDALTDGMKEKADEIKDASAAKAVVAELERKIESYGVKVRREVEEFDRLQAFLNDDESRNSLKEEYQKAQQLEGEAGNQAAAAGATLESLLKDREFDSKEEAEDELRKAGELRECKEEENRKISEEYKGVKAEADRVRGLIERYSVEIPKLTDERENTLKKYRDILEEKKFAEDEWISLTESYSLETAEELRENFIKWSNEQDTAEALKKSSKEAIGDTKKPDMDVLKELRSKADEECERARAQRDECRECYRNDAELFEELDEKADDRRLLIEEQSKLSSLYETLAGKVSGARMDIETFVQRNYLEMVLENANRRFENMSRGQFELRMIDIDKAGEGRMNHGLDLMVYSNVTGKSREVRTLSGGESFMAALSLALGMADVITESAASVNLDIMFIDEGFGSLDDNSRDQAVKILKEMAGGSRTIGIISHVTELKQQIDSQLIVSKDEEGSHTRWQFS
ncbi:MAG: SMC family ATPase [Lachnospiraceae bacterium]|nr:SMC family ATPase [Lachnospiraceae bacterium]